MAIETMGAMEERKITIRDAVVELEEVRKSTVISYVALPNAMIAPEDAGLLVDTIEMVLPPEGGKLEKLDLFLTSFGGFLDSAYKVVRICQEYSKEFNVIVPLAAKSAATLICLGAKEIVMTSFSELGPIDPIIQHPYKPEVKVPARAIKDFFVFLNTAQTQNITVDQSVKQQMASLLDPYLIGSYQTALQSSRQIADKLLREGGLKENPALIEAAVSKLTEYYISHSFVIDRKEAADLGLNILFAENDKKLSKAVRQLLNIYQGFMMSNKIIKLVGNREINRNIIQQPPGGSPESLGTGSVHT